MKIKKLEKKSDGLYDLSEVPEKINEIINLLNNSFITQDSDTITVEDTLLTDITCDRLTPCVNETTATLQQKSIYNNAEPRGLFDDIKCPRCGAKYFTVGPSYCTAVYYPPIYKDGVNINPDRNITKTSYTCFECGHSWEENS